MTIFRRYVLFFAVVSAFWPLMAQKSIRDSSIQMGYVSIVYAPGAPRGDLAKRFGFTNEIGAEGGIKLKNNLYATSGLKFLFGNEIKEPVARNVVQVRGSASTGYSTMALGADGRFYSVRFYERGFVIPLLVGKIFPLSKKQNRNSGLYVELGAQFIQHKVSINAIGDNVPYLAKPYLKGYDRLSNGMGTVEGFGYRYFSNNRFANFFLGAEFSQNFTQNRRLINVDTGIADRSKRKDLLYAFKVGWTFPIYKSAPEKEYYY